jgi:hypothetical protein
MVATVFVSQVQRIEIECPMEEKAQILRYVDSGDYVLVRHGPKLLSPTKVDTTIFTCVAEKVLSRSQG